MHCSDCPLPTTIEIEISRLKGKVFRCVCAAFDRLVALDTEQTVRRAHGVRGNGRLLLKEQLLALVQSCRDSLGPREVL